MDILSHGLWTNVVYLKCRRRDRWWAVAFALLPDLIPFGPFFFQELAVHGIHDGPPTFAPAALAWITATYQFTHSLIVFVAVFGIVTLCRRGRMVLPMLAWGLHVLTDIPTHRRTFFPTPFLWPLSDYSVDAISWADPRFFYPNLLALVVVYVIIGLYWVRRRRFART